MIGGSKLVGVTARFSFFCFFGGDVKNGLYLHIVSEITSSLFLNNMPR